MEVCLVSGGDFLVQQVKSIKFLNNNLIISYVSETTEGNIWIKDGKIFGQWDMTESLDYIERIDFYVFGKTYSLYEFTVDEIIDTLDFLK